MSAQAGVVSVDGRITPVAEGRISVMDHGFLYGDSVYEVVRTFAGRPVAMARHLARLRNSASMLYLALPWSDAEISARIRAAFEASAFRDAYVRLVITRGEGPMTLLPDQCARPSILVYVLPLVVPGRDEVERGIGVVVVDRLRNDRRAISPEAKTGNYLNNALALVEAKKAGGDDAVMANPEGFVTEGTTSNVFWAERGRLLTPSLDSGILAGVTRALLLEALAGEGIPVEEGRYPADRFRACDEAFLTGTIRGVSPVVRIDARPVGDGRPGPLTRRVVAVNERLLAANAAPW